MEKNFFDLSSLTLDANGRTEVGDADLEKLQGSYAGGQFVPEKNVENCPKSNSSCKGTNKPSCINAPFCGGSTNIDCQNGLSCGGSKNTVCTW
jgi:hypothetical protein